MNYSGGSVIGERLYNFIIGAVLAWGFAVDFVICLVCGDIIYSLNVWVMVIGYIGITLLSTMIIYRSNNPAVSFLGFTILAAAMGLLISGLVTLYTPYSVLQAFVQTVGVSIAVGVCASLFPSFFLKIGRSLFACLLVTVIIEIIWTMVTGSTPFITSLAIVIIFAAYLGYDLAKAQAYVKTVDNAIDSAADIYVDVVNLFIRLLAMFGDRR